MPTIVYWICRVWVHLHWTRIPSPFTRTLKHMITRQEHWAHLLLLLWLLMQFHLHILNFGHNAWEQILQSSFIDLNYCSDAMIMRLASSSSQSKWWWECKSSEPYFTYDFVLVSYLSRAQLFLTVTHKWSASVDIPLQDRVQVGGGQTSEAWARQHNHP